MTAATGDAATSSAAEALLDGLANAATKVLVEAPEASRGPEASSAPGRVLLAPDKRESKAANGEVYTVGGLRSAPGRYMQHRLDDEGFNAYIVGEMTRYLRAKLQHGARLSVKAHAPGFRHIPAHKQIGYRLKKRELDAARHGHQRVQSLAAAGALGPLRVPGGIVAKGRGDAN